MDTTDLHPLVEDLEENIDELEESLAPLLNSALSASTSKLPLLDKAKLYVLTTYAIESLLFSYLRMNGVDAKNHAIFQELTRVKHYFDKLKTAETGPAKPTARLDKNAAGRFIKAGLAGNEEYDRQRKETQDRERAGAKRKFEDMGETVGSHSRFASIAKKIRAEDGDGEEDTEDQGEEVVAEAEHMEVDNTTTTSHKKSKKDKSHKSDGTKKSKKKSKLESTATEPASSPNPSNTETVLPKRQKSSKPPRGASEAFQALLNGPLPPKEDCKEKKKKKRKSGD